MSELSNRLTDPDLDEIALLLHRAQERLRGSGTATDGDDG